MAGKIYFRGLPLDPARAGRVVRVALHAAGTRVLPDLFPHFIATQVQPAELMQLVAAELSGPSPKFMTGELGHPGARRGPLRAHLQRRRAAAHRGAHQERTKGASGARPCWPTSVGPPYGYVNTVGEGLRGGPAARGQGEGAARERRRDHSHP
jgi:hypothetical protein